MNKLLLKISNNKSILLIILLAFVFRTLYGMSINFSEEKTQSLQDYTQIYLLGLKFYTAKIWPYWGPDITYTASQIPGALQALLVGLPFYIIEDKAAPFVFLNILSSLALAFFAWYITKRIPGIPKWFAYIWLLTAPWTLNYSTTVTNPSYVLAPAVFFFIGFLEVLPIYTEKIWSARLSYFLMGFAMAWILQIHMSWILLPFYVVIAFYFLLKTKNVKTITQNLFFLGLGFILMLSTVIPTLLKYGFVTGDSESAIVLNISNLKNVDVVTRFISFSTFEVRDFIVGGNEGKKAFLLDHLWLAPITIILFVLGISQVIYYLSFLFRKTGSPEFKFAKRITIVSIILVYLSYLFAIRNMATYTFYILLPISFWFSFYCLENLFKKAIWKKVAAFMLISGLLHHIVLAKTYYPTNAIETKTNLIEQAFEHKDSRLFAYRRTANWEKAERTKLWRKSIKQNENAKILSYSNGFDTYPIEILPETFVNTFYVSPPFACQMDSMNPYSQSLIIPLHELNGKNKVNISLMRRYTDFNDCVIAIAIKKGKEDLFWFPQQICKDSLNLNKWSYYKTSFDLPKNLEPANVLEVVAYLPEHHYMHKVQIDDLKIDFK